MKALLNNVHKKENKSPKIPPFYFTTIVGIAHILAFLPVLWSELFQIRYCFDCLNLDAEVFFLNGVQIRDRIFLHFGNFTL